MGLLPESASGVFPCAASHAATMTSTPSQVLKTTPKYLVPHAAPARRPASSAAATMGSTSAPLFPTPPQALLSVAPLSLSGNTLACCRDVSDARTPTIPATASAAAQQYIASPLSTYAKPSVLFTGPIMKSVSAANRPGTPLFM